MRCTPMVVDGTPAIVCGRAPTKRCACGNEAGMLCDWKVGKNRTCDVPLCDGCTTSPAPGKDLCPGHAEAWATHPRNPAAA